MPSAKSGKAASPVPPAKPADAQEADVADPGMMKKIKARQEASGKGRYGQQKLQKPKESKDEKEESKKPKTAWIEIEIVGEDGTPLPGIAFDVELPDGSLVSGSTDDKGVGRVEGFEPGNCLVILPDFDKEAWEPA